MGMNGNNALVKFQFHRLRNFGFTMFNLYELQALSKIVITYECSDITTSTIVFVMNR